MNRDKFEEEISKINRGELEYGTYINRPMKLDKTMSKSIETAKKDYIKNPDFNQLIVVIEEMSELTQELTKFLRDKGNRTGILEELADVQICNWMVMKMLNITDEELNQAIQVKMNRQEKKQSVDSGDGIVVESYEDRYYPLYDDDFADTIAKLSHTDRCEIMYLLYQDRKSLDYIIQEDAKSVSNKLKVVDHVLGPKGRTIYALNGKTFDNVSKMIVQKKFADKYSTVSSSDAEQVIDVYRDLLTRFIFSRTECIKIISRMKVLLSIESSKK